MATYMDLRGTSSNNFKIGKVKWNFDASGATALRQFVLGDLPVDLNTGGTNDVLTRGPTSISFQPAGAGGGYTYYGTNTTLGGNIQGDVVIEGDLTGLTSGTLIRGNLYVTGAITVDDSLTVYGTIFSGNGTTVQTGMALTAFGVAKFQTLTLEDATVTTFQADIIASNIVMENSAQLLVYGDVVVSASFIGGSLGNFSGVITIRGNLFTGLDLLDSQQSFAATSTSAGCAINIGGDFVCRMCQIDSAATFYVAGDMHCAEATLSNAVVEIRGNLTSKTSLSLGDSSNATLITIYGDVKAESVTQVSYGQVIVKGSVVLQQFYSAGDSQIVNFLEINGDLITGSASANGSGTVLLEGKVNDFLIRIGGSVVGKNLDFTSNDTGSVRGDIEIGGNVTCNRTDLVQGSLKFGAISVSGTDRNNLRVGGNIAGFNIDGKATQQGHGSDLYCGGIFSHIGELVEVDLRGRDKTSGGAARGGGSLFCGGSVHGNVRTRGGGHSSVTSGNGKGGSVYIAGDCHGFIETGLYQGAGDYGGPANDITVLGSVLGPNGVKAEPGNSCDVDDPASIDIHGDVAGQISARAYNSSGLALQGGTVLIRGSAWGGAFANGINGGDGGDIQINGNCKGGVDSTGGGDGSESVVGGAGGNISIYGTLVDGDVRLSGGQGSTGGNAGHLVLGGPATVSYLEMNGGVSATQNGNCGSCATQSIACVEFHARDGQGGGAAPSSTKRLIMSGDIRIGQMDFEARATVFWRPANASPGIPTTLKVDSFAAGSDTFIDNHDESADRDLAGAIQDYFYFYSASALAWYGVQGT